MSYILDMTPPMTNAPDELQEQMERELFAPNHMDIKRHFVHIIAAIRWLDEHTETHREGYILLNRSVPQWSSEDIVILDESLKSLHAKATDDLLPVAELKLADQEFYDLAVHPFRIQVNDAPWIPENIRGQTLKIAFMSFDENESHDLKDFAAVSVDYGGVLLGTQRFYARSA